MRVRVVRPGEMSDGEVMRWAEIQRGIDALDSPFLSPHFCIAIGEQRATARVAILEQDGRPVGFFPYEHHRVGIGKPIGSSLSDYQAVVAEGPVHLPQVLGACDLGAWDFDHLAGSQQRLLGDAHVTTTVEAPVIDLREGFESYEKELRARSRSLLQSTARSRRRLERDVGRARFDLRSTDHSTLDLMLGWKSDQYRRTGRRDRFADPGNRRLVHRLLDTSLPDFAGGLAVLSAGHRPVSALFYVRSSTVVSYWFPAYDPAYHTFSPGIVMLLDLARALGESESVLVDLGKGSEPYKERFQSWTYPLLEGRASRNRLVAAVREAYLGPRDRAVAAVLGSEMLRRRARTALRWSGGVRQSVRRLRPRA